MNTLTYRLGQYVLLVLIVVSAGTGCRTTPITGRKQVLLLPEQQEVAMGLDAFEQVKSRETRSTDQRNTEMVNRVGRRIADAARRHDYEWEFLLIASPEQNAFCLPGGKVAVSEGILPICANEAGLAVVMSHEIAHALARHGGERMTQSMAVAGVRRAVDYFTKDKEERQREMVAKAYGLGAKYGVILPYSRKHETEADHMGLMLMAEAGYDPAEAPQFWRRFAEAKQEGAPPEFLSTHPSDERRAETLLALLPEAQRVFQERGALADAGRPIDTALPVHGAPPPAAALRPMALIPHNAVYSAPPTWRSAEPLPSVSPEFNVR